MSWNLWWPYYSYSCGSLVQHANRCHFRQQSVPATTQVRLVLGALQKVSLPSDTETRERENIMSVWLQLTARHFHICYHQQATWPMCHTLLTAGTLELALLLQHNLCHNLPCYLLPSTSNMANVSHTADRWDTRTSTAAAAQPAPQPALLFATINKQHGQCVTHCWQVGH